MRSPYTREYLHNLQYSGSNNELEIRNVFERIQDALKNQEFTTTMERDFFCRIREHLLTDEIPSDYNACDEFIFEKLYFQYVTFDNLDCTKEQTDFKGNLISKEQRKLDRLNLDRYTSEWLDLVASFETINNDPDRDPFLKAILRETKDMFKELKRNQSDGDSLSEGINYEKKRVVLFQRWIYKKSKIYVEGTSVEDRKIEIGDFEFIIDEYSFAHVLSRHFGQTLKSVYTEKSVFSPEFRPENIVKQLSNIFELVNESGYIDEYQIKDRIYFEYRDKIYAVYFKQAHLNRKGIKPLIYYRLNSFYPVESVQELMNIDLVYEAFQISDELTVLLD